MPKPKKPKSSSKRGDKKKAAKSDYEFSQLKKTKYRSVLVHATQKNEL